MLLPVGTRFGLALLLTVATVTVGCDSETRATTGTFHPIPTATGYAFARDGINLEALGTYEYTAVEMNKSTGYGLKSDTIFEVNLEDGLASPISLVYDSASLSRLVSPNGHSCHCPNSQMSDSTQTTFPIFSVSAISNDELYFSFQSSALNPINTTSITLPGLSSILQYKYDQPNQPSKSSYQSYMNYLDIDNSILYINQGFRCPIKSIVNYVNCPPNLRM